MNPHQCRVELRRRDPFESFDLALRFVRERRGPLLRLAVVVLGPVFGAACLALWLTEGHLAVLAVVLPVLPVVRAPFTLLAGRLMFADKVPGREIVPALVARTPALLGAWLVLALAVLLSALTLFYALLFVQAGLLYLVEAALLERVPPARAVRRSLRLAAGHLGVAFAGAFGTLALTVWGLAVGEAAGLGVVHQVLQVPPIFGSLLEGDATPYAVLGMLGVQPLIAVYRLLLYVDVRTRVEGWDLQVALRAAGLASQRGREEDA